MWILLYSVYSIHNSYMILGDIYSAHKITIYEQ